MLLTMIRRLPVALVLALLVTATPARASDTPSADERAAAQRIVEQITRLREAMGQLGAEDGVDAGARSTGAPAGDELMLRLLALRQEIDQILILLEAQPPAVRGEVGRLLGAASVPSAVEVPTATPAEENAAPAPVRAPVPTPRAPAAPAPERRAPTACAPLAPFDSNADGVLSGLDRYWRYFRLWSDDGDGVMEARELSGLYDSGVAELALAARTYRTVDGTAGDLIAGRVLRLEGLGRRGRAVLTLDADRLARGGELELRDAAGAALTGRQALSPEMVVTTADGESSVLGCR